ncbi:hypothetical protein HMPREF1322_1088 [Porphyromonas gingivalis W50]|nr:hypothetical protein HMPREF1322_1088 [Porphyromonas gingivalis W50]
MHYSAKIFQKLFFLVGLNRAKKIGLIKLYSLVSPKYIVWLNQSI